MLAPFADRIEVADAIVIGEPMRNGPVDVALYDTFGQPVLQPSHLAQLVQDPAIGTVAIYSFDHTEADLLAAMDAGAAAYLSKATPADRLADQLERIASGEEGRSPTRLP